MSKPSKQRVLKFTIQQYRNPGVTEDEFHTYWSEKHAGLASPWLVRHGILKYAQYHTPSTTRNLVAGMAAKRGWGLASYDGQVEILCDSFEDLVEACADPEYPDRIGKDEDRFVDHSRSVVSLGWEEVHVDDGKIVEGGGRGKDFGEARKGEEGLSAEELVCRMVCGLYYFLVLVVFCWQVLGRGAVEW